MSIADELNKCEDSLRAMRNAVVGRGGEIAIDAGFKDMSDAIWNIPADNALGFYTDNASKYKKIVPAKSTSKALIKRIGGYSDFVNDLMEHATVTKLQSKGAQLLPPKTIDYEKYGCVWKSRDDGGIDVSGTPDSSSATTDLYDGVPLGEGTITLSGAPTDSNIKLTFVLYDASGAKLSGSTVAAPGKSFSLNLSDYPTVARMRVTFARNETGTECKGTVYPMLNLGTEPAPYQQYTTDPIDAFTIPEEVIAACPDYGVGVNSDAYNYIEWENGKVTYVQMVAYNPDNENEFEVLGEPIEKDITDLFTVDNHIEVQGGGAIIAVNDNELSAPSFIKYTIETGG